MARIFIFLAPALKYFLPLLLGEELLDAPDSPLQPTGNRMEVDPPATESAGPLPKGLGSEIKPTGSLPEGRTSATMPSNAGAYKAGPTELGEMVDPDPATMASLEKGFNANLYTAIRKLRSAALCPRNSG